MTDRKYLSHGIALKDFTKFNAYYLVSIYQSSHSFVDTGRNCFDVS